MSTKSPDIRDQDAAMGSSVPPKLRMVVFAGLFAWSLVAFLLRSWDAWRPPPVSHQAPAILWRLDTVQVDAWTEFAEAVTQRLPRGERLLVTAPESDPADEFFWARWCAYLMPELKVVRKQNLLPGEVLPQYRLRPSSEGSYLRVNTSSNSLEIGGTGRGPEKDIDVEVLLVGPGVLEKTRAEEVNP